MTKIKNGENQNTEYKESWRDEYLKWICGFANASGGSIYIGVNDDKEIIGVDGFEAAGIPMPRVQNFCGGVQVTVQRTKFMQMMNVGKDVGKDVGNMSETQLTDRQTKICKLIKDYPHISAKRLSDVLSVVPRTIERDLSELQKEGVIIREGSKTAGHWVLLKQIKD